MCADVVNSGSKDFIYCQEELLQPDNAMNYSFGKKRNTRLNPATKGENKFLDILSGVSSLFQLLLRLVIVLTVVVLIILVYMRSRSDDYFLQSLNVPPVLTERGFDGYVISMKILDELIALQNNTRSSKTSNRVSSRESEDDVSVQMMGIGLSINSVVGYIEGLFGKKKRMISGDITEENGVLTLTLRFTDSTPKVFRAASQDALFGDEIKMLIGKAANEILNKTDPYYVAIRHIYNLQYDKCIKMCQQIISSGHRDSNWAYLLWTDILITQDRYGECLKLVDKAIHEYPDFFQLYERKFSCLRKMGEWERAQEELLNGFEQDDQSEPEYLVFVECLTALGDDSLTTHQIAAMRSEYPDSFHTLGVLAYQAYVRQRLDSALWFADQRLLAAGNDYRLLVKVADGYLAIDRPDKSLEVANKLFELDSGVLAWQIAKESYAQLGRQDMAMNCASMIFELSEKDAPSYYFYANALIEAGNIEEGKAYLLKSVELDSKFISSLLRLSEVFDTQGNKAEARRYIRLFYKESPQASGDRWELADHFQRWNEFDSSIYYLKTCVNRVPRDPDFLNDLAYNYELAGSLDSARKYVSRALRYNPQHGYSYSTLAEIQGLEAKADSFFITLERAVRYGYRLSEDNFDKEPYHTFRDDPRLKKLLHRD